MTINEIHVEMKKYVKMAFMESLSYNVEEGLWYWFLGSIDEVCSICYIS